MKTTIFILLACLISCFFYMKSLNGSNHFLKDRNYNLTNENNKLKEQIKEYGSDKNLYKKENDIFINIGLLPLKKVVNLEELEALKFKGYK